ncbi:MAG TPA: (deoxy)nucleoside triphosphate pyrophosphohydrolase [Novosphingobium sp.]|nr:(deoxy)nucleoside triphosphate pyrophosphohydrolase [Novosphingobium sp.]HMP57260.1 (deoxy)nucleoside triphosphate pyrophosphohydrolase [Novosphingobium sp.]
MHVVAAALLRGDGLVLMQRRPEGAVHGGLWEFPGGKVEPGESRESALLRELREELGIGARQGNLRHAARASEVLHGTGTATRLVIDLYIVTAWAGEPQCLPGARIDWFAPETVPSLAMPPLDYPLAEGLLKAMARK